MKTQELAVTRHSESEQFVSAIERMAKDPSVDVSKLEKLLALQRDERSRMAESEFNFHLCECEKEIQPVFRDAKNPQTNSKYTTLEMLIESIRPVYTKHGFSLSFGTADCPIKECYRIVCHVSHSAGHTRQYHVDVPSDYLGMKGNPNKTLTHAFGSTMSYGRRYLTLLIFNIALTDDDGNQGKQQEQKGPMRATDQTRNRMIEVLKEAGLEAKAQEYAIFKDWIQPGDTLHGWPLDNVPVNKAEMETLRQAIANFKPE